MTTIPVLTLNTGHDIPQLGFGVFQVPPDETQAAVEIALDVGYRHIDTAALYRNEEGVGAAIAASGVPREDLFITTKVWPSDFARDATLRAFDVSLDKLRLDYLDLYLLHWPAPRRGLFPEAWATLVELQREGRVRSVGVSNFEPEHLRQLADANGVVPAVNQIELHPYLQQERLRSIDQEQGIVTEAWSPLAQGGVLDDPTLAEIADAHDADVARVALAWSLRLGNVVLTKSVTPERIRGNVDALSLELSDDDMQAIAQLDRGRRVGPDPNEFDG